MIKNVVFDIKEVTFTEGETSGFSTMHETLNSPVEGEMLSNCVQVVSDVWRLPDNPCLVRQK